MMDGTLFLKEIKPKIVTVGDSEKEDPKNDSFLI